MQPYANSLVIDNMRDDFPHVLQTLRDSGSPVKPSGRLQYELRGVSLVLKDPSDALPLGTLSRPYDLALPAVRALELVSGFADPVLVHRIADHHPHHSIGPEIRYGLDSVTRLLLADSSTSDALIRVPNLSSSTISLHFFWRDGAIELHVVKKQEDVVRACLSEIFAFTQLQLSVANFLNERAGDYYHYADSFYFSASDIGLLDHIHLTTELTKPPDLPTGFGDGSQTTWDDLALRARFVLDVGSGRRYEGVNANAFTPSERWYLEQLRPHWRQGG